MWSTTEQSTEMDILDVDEELKDDSIFASDDRTHADVCNILQQWKSNWLPTQEKEQAYKLNSKTFTRPKKKQFLNTHLENNETQNLVGNSNHQQSNQSVQRNDSVISLEIGGYVTNMHKSFLQDTSPPASICSSMDVSIDQFNNSLITSADFGNISFLQQSSCLDSFQNLINNRGDETCTFTDKLSNNGYTINDLIRDRKALDSLTLSADGTLIKDSNIAQIDDISFTLSKTTSSCSTMDNSTNSVESNNVYNVEVSNKNCTYDSNKADIFQKTVILNNDMINDTFNLVPNSFVIEKAENELIHLNVTQNLDVDQVNSNKTFRKQTPLDETIYIAGNPNTTFDNLPEVSNSRCETPENCIKAANFCISTPHINNLGPKKQQFTPTLNKTDEVNISPIRGDAILSETYKHACNNKSPDSYCAVKIENDKNSTFNKSFQCLNQSGTGSKDVPNVLELANAEAELLASNGDEVQFEHMLEELSRVHMSYDQTKMKMSLNSIKKRLGTSKPSPNCKNEKDIDSSPNNSNGDGSKNKEFSDTISKESSVGSSSSSDRLLSRRSRLYDNINITTLPDNKNNSFVISSEDNSKRNIDTKIQNCLTSKPLTDTDSFQENSVTLADTQPPDSTYVPLTRRERDRERFKTIKIIRDHGTSQPNSNLQNLPCIDNDGSVITDNKGFEIESNKTTNYLTYKKPKEEYIKRQLPNKSNTYIEAFPAARQPSSSAGQQRSLSRPRYISGLQKFSAVSKATSAGDLDISANVANSANENMVKQELKASGVMEKNRGALSKELKSPMGIKSKSFHNLSFQSGYNNAGSTGVVSRNPQSRLTRPGAKTYSQTANVERMQQNQKMDDLFKVPKVLNRPSNIKYAGLPRPSSGYYSLSIPGKGQPHYGEAAIEYENDFSTENTVASDPIQNNTAHNEATNRAKENKDELTDTNNKLSSKPIKSATGIPKPSGIRPPSNMKRSCLPRPSSITRH